MKCETSDLEIETIVSRIKKHDINLQPNFQRGEVWSPLKKKKLIDSILRGWKIPPIHVVRNSIDAVDEVLDGQQRLVSIRDFVANDFSIDGYLTPNDPEMQKLNDVYFDDLPKPIQRRFNQYTIIFVRLTEFNPEEPAELFYRLNQPVALTAAEQRNAFIGTTRDQIKILVNLFEKLGADKATIGFSNSRLAYDEVISKFCYTVEAGTLRKKITANAISDKYRMDEPFSGMSLSVTEKIIRVFMNIVIHSDSSIYKLTFNKATLFSWFIFLKRHYNIEVREGVELINSFERSRDYLKGKLKTNLVEDHGIWMERIQKQYPFIEVMLNIFNQRASMGSTDAVSIIYRDIILNIYYDIYTGNLSELVDYAGYSFTKRSNMSFILEEISDHFNWGVEF